MYMFKTKGVDTWNLRANAIGIGNKVKTGIDIQIDLDPALPYIYAPDEHYSNLIE